MGSCVIIRNSFIRGRSGINCRHNEEEWVKWIIWWNDLEPGGSESGYRSIEINLEGKNGEKTEEEIDG